MMSVKLIPPSDDPVHSDDENIFRPTTQFRFDEDDSSFSTVFDQKEEEPVTPRVRYRYRYIPIGDFELKYDGNLEGRAVLNKDGETILLVSKHGSNPDEFTGTKAFSYRCTFNRADITHVRVYSYEWPRPLAPKKYTCYDYEAWLKRAQNFAEQMMIEEEEEDGN